MEMVFRISNKINATKVKKHSENSECFFNIEIKLFIYLISERRNVFTIPLASAGIDARLITISPDFT